MDDKNKSINKYILKYKKKYPVLKDITIVCDRIINNFQIIDDGCQYKRQIVLTTPNDISNDFIINDIWDEDDKEEFKSTKTLVDGYKIIAVFTFYFGLSGKYYELVESHCEMKIMEKERHALAFLTKVMSSIEWNEDEMNEFQKNVSEKC